MDSSLLWLGLGAAALLVLGMNSAPVSAAINTAVDWANSAAFRLALPANVAQWSDFFLAAAEQAGVSPWLLAGICYRESGGGDALHPQGPGGTGDFNPRPAGRRYPSGYVVGPNGMPEDGGGWGRGLMQLDWAVQFPWPQQNNWADPATNINKAANILATNILFFSSDPNPSGITVESWRLKGLTSATGKVLVQGWADKYGLQSTGPYSDPRPLTGTDLALAAVAAYNAGTSGVLQAIAAGLPADAATAGNNYGSWISTRVSAWLATYAPNTSGDGNA